MEKEIYYWDNHIFNYAINISLTANDPTLVGFFVCGKIGRFDYVR